MRIRQLSLIDHSNLETGLDADYLAGASDVRATIKNHQLSSAAALLIPLVSIVVVG